MQEISREPRRLHWTLRVDNPWAMVARGERVTINGLPTRELLNLQVSIRGCPAVGRSDLNPHLGSLMALQILAQSSWEDLLVSWAEGLDAGVAFKHYDDPKRVQSQLIKVTKDLVIDRSTQRAIIVAENTKGYYRNNSCVSTVQFLIRGNELITTVNLSSLDMVKEFPLVIISWCILGRVVANCMGVSGLSTVFNAASAHVYERDLPLLDSMNLRVGEMRVPYYHEIEDYSRWSRALLEMLAIRHQAHWCNILEDGGLEIHYDADDGNKHDGEGSSDDGGIACSDHVGSNTDSHS